MGMANFVFGAVATVLLLVGCAVEWQTREPAKELAKLSSPPGSIYTGWRVFQARSVSCYGQAATGTANAPKPVVTRGRDGEEPFRRPGLASLRLKSAAGLDRRRSRGTDREHRAAQRRRAHDADVARRTYRQRTHCRSVRLFVGARGRQPGAGSADPRPAFCSAAPRRPDLLPAAAKPEAPAPAEDSESRGRHWW